MPSHIGPACPGLPPFMYTSLMGIHIRDFNAFMRSDLCAPVSEDPEKKQWAQNELCWAEDVDPETQHVFRQEDISKYNRSRDTDRICPACRRWYRVGEKGFKDFNTFEEFINRPALEVPEVPLIVSAFQDKRGICTSVCYMVRSSLWHGLFREGASHLHPDLVEEINGATMGGLGARKPITEEKAQGIQIVYCTNALDST